MSTLPAAVTFSADPTTEPKPFVHQVLAAAPTDLTSALDFLRRLGSAVPVPGSGRTLELWEALATLAAIDLGVARAAEPQFDALAILDQADRADLTGDRLWGVYAAEAPDAVLTAKEGRLTGTKAWCSLAQALDSALVTARVADGTRALFAVDLHDAGVTVESGTWHSRGLAEIPSGPVRFDAVPATAVGEGEWYLTRPGFSWGGIGVAACWYGGAVAIGRTMYETARRRPDDAVLSMHLGAVDEALGSARRALAEAANLVDDGSAVGAPGRLLAKRVRSTVARAAEDVILRAGHALGPAPLALDESHAKRVADLTVYVRQHHAERDDISLGSAIASSERAPW